MTTSNRPPERGEEHVRDLFARAGSGSAPRTGSGTGTGSGAGTASEELLGRIFTAALRRRRRNSILTVAGAAASSVAVVAALVVGPTLLRADREAAGPASSASSTLTLATGTSTDAATMTVAPTNATATVSGPTTSAPVAPTPADTGATTRPAGPAGTTPTVPSSRTGGSADPYAGLLKLFPAPTSIDPGMSWSLEPGLAPAGAAPVMGLQICDQIVVTEALGKAGFAAAEKQVTAAMASTTTGKDWPGVDIVLAVWPPGHGEAAWAQLKADKGMCIWHGTPTVTAWSGHTGLLVTRPEVMMAKFHTAAAVQLVGDVTVGVTAFDTDRAAALRRAQTLCDALAADVRASGIGQG